MSTPIMFFCARCHYNTLTLSELLEHVREQYSVKPFPGFSE